MQCMNECNLLRRLALYPPNPICLFVVWVQILSSKRGPGGNEKEKGKQILHAPVMTMMSTPLQYFHCMHVVKSPPVFIQDVGPKNEASEVLVPPPHADDDCILKTTIAATATTAAAAAAAGTKRTTTRLRACSIGTPAT